MSENSGVKKEKGILRELVIFLIIVLSAQAAGFVYNISTPGKLLMGVLLLIFLVHMAAGAALAAVRKGAGANTSGAEGKGAGANTSVAEGKGAGANTSGAVGKGAGASTSGAEGKGAGANTSGAVAEKSILILTVLVMAVAFIIKAEYIIYTPTWIRQHDVIGFGSGIGQAGFIEYFYDGLRLIDFDPRDKWGFFQPPLHHMIAAIWLHIQRWIGDLAGWSMDQCRENVQVLTLIYSTVTAWFGIKILKRLRIGGACLITGAMLVAAHPCLIQMAGSINNDMLCVTLQIMGMYFFIGWMYDEKPGELILTALCMGLSMMAKLSGIMLAVPIGCIMLLRLWQAVSADREAGGSFAGTRKLVLQYLVFALISIPIGIWSPVRNYIRFGVPLMYTPKVGEPIEGVSILDRLINPGPEHTPFTCMIANGNSYDEFNVPLAILKTSLFGEADFSMLSAFAAPLGWVMLISAALLAILTAIAMIRLLTEKTAGSRAAYVKSTAKESAAGKIAAGETAGLGAARGIDTEKQVLVFMAIYILFSLFFLVRLCFAIPNFSSQDFRYIAHIIIPGAAMLCLYMQKAKKQTALTIFAITAIFCGSSLAMYFIAGRMVW